MRRDVFKLWASEKGRVFNFLHSIGCGFCVRLFSNSEQERSSHANAWKQDNPLPGATQGRRESETNGRSIEPPMRESCLSSSDESDDDDNAEEQWVQMTSKP